MRKTATQQGIWPGRILHLVLSAGFMMLPASAQETAVDGILAVVNDEVITLTDFRVVQSFGLFADDNGGDLSSWGVLDRLIEQKLIIWVANPELSVPVIELESRYRRLSDTLGAETMQRRLEEFDLNRDEFYAYLSEMIVSRRILEQRFQRSVTVSLKEIEAYYNQTYVPQRKAGGQEPEPMLEVLDRLEAAVRMDETRVLIREWVRNLRKEADIEVYADNYPQFFARIQRKGP